MKSPCAVNLHNAVTVLQQLLGKRVAQLSSARMNEVCVLCASLWGAIRTSYWKRSVCPRVSLTPEFPVHDLHCLSRVLAARFLPPGEVEDRAHALTGRANATIAHLMYGDEVLAPAFGRLREEVEQAITFRESLFRVGIRFYLANVHRDRIVTGFWLAQHLHCWRARRPSRAT